jgi:hypothetical protein
MMLCLHKKQGFVDTMIEHHMAHDHVASEQPKETTPSMGTDCSKRARIYLQQSAAHRSTVAINTAA